VRTAAVLPLALAAFALLALEGTRGGRRRGAARGPLAAALLAALALPGLVDAAEPGQDPLEARAGAGDAGALLRLGVERARRGLHAQAQPALVAAALYARDPELAALAYYDLGVVALEEGLLMAARDAFFDALAFDPELVPARRNLEWTLRALTAPEPPPAQSPQAGSEAQPPPEPEPGAGDEPAEAAPEVAPEEERSSPGESEIEAGAQLFVPELGADEVARWLEAVEDDPGRALRGAVQEEPGPGRRTGPRW
jgi:hypothetical protein